MDDVPTNYRLETFVPVSEKTARSWRPELHREED